MFMERWLFECVGWCVQYDWTGGAQVDVHRFRQIRAIDCSSGPSCVHAATDLHFSLFFVFFSLFYLSAWLMVRFRNRLGNVAGVIQSRNLRRWYHFCRRYAHSPPPFFLPWSFLSPLLWFLFSPWRVREMRRRPTKHKLFGTIKNKQTTQNEIKPHVCDFVLFFHKVNRCFIKI